MNTSPKSSAKRSNEKTSYVKLDKRVLFGGIIALILVFGVSIGLLFAQMERKTFADDEIQKASPTPIPSPSPTPSPSPSPSPIPSPVPSPKPSPAAKKPANTEATGCAQFKPENGQVFVRVNLVLKSGSSMVGRTVVRVKPTGTCPNESATVEHWMNEGEMSWTTPGLNPGRYRIEVANGNYQGVIAETHNLTSGGYQFNIGVHGQ